MYPNFIKRIFDFILASIGIIVLSPLIFLITIILFIANKGKPFFIQNRPGKNEQIFKIIKFKTMNDATDENGHLLPDNKRLTIVGSIIRKLSLDEIPQLFNVIKGDMSLVGPRPLLVQYLPYYTEREKLRHRVRPGITGYAQINGRNLINWDERLEMDVQYVENLTFKLDIYILIKTIINVIKRKDVIVIPSSKYTTLDKHRNNEIQCK